MCDVKDLNVGIENDGRFKIELSVSKDEQVKTDSVSLSVDLEKMLKLQTQISPLIAKAEDLMNANILPDIFKVYINCGKVKEFEYYLADIERKTSDELQDKPLLYRVVARMVDGTSVQKFWETKFFKDEKILKTQINQLHGIRLIFKDTAPECAHSFSDGKRGFNGPLDKSLDEYESLHLESGRD